MSTDLSRNKLEMDRLGALQNADGDPHHDFLFYSFVGILHKLNLCESEDVYSTYKWIVGDE